MIPSFTSTVGSLVLFVLLCPGASNAFTAACGGSSKNLSLQLSSQAGSSVPDQHDGVATTQSTLLDANLPFPYSSPPFLAIITERSSCDDNQRLQTTLEVLRKATSTRQVDLISVRISLPESDRNERKERVLGLVKQLVELSKRNGFRVVVSSDWIDVAVEAGAHGVHFKETHRHLIPEVRRRFQHEPLIGTSAHSVGSALDAWDEYHPDYYFVGTCYLTESHPEKIEADLEGPALPGIVRAKLHEYLKVQTPPVLAIGGIDPSNCHEPMNLGADGVAVIRALFFAKEPLQAASDLKRNIRMRNE